MPANKYIYPFIFNYGDYHDYDDDRTITRYKEIPKKKNCDSDLLDNPCCNFNVSRCNTDLEYYQPVCVAPNPCYCLRFNGDLGEPYEDIPINQGGGAFYTQPHVNFGSSIGEIGLDDFEITVDFNSFGVQMPGNTGVLLSRTNRFKVADSAGSYWILGITEDNGEYRLFFSYTAFIINSICIMTLFTNECSIIQGNNRIIIGRKNLEYYVSVNNVNKSYSRSITFGPCQLSDLDNVTVTNDGHEVSFIMGSHSLENTTWALKGGICAVKMVIAGATQLNWKAKSAINNILTPEVGTPGYMTYFPTGDKNAKWMVNSHCFDDCDPCDLNACTETDLLYFQFQYPDNFNDWKNDIITSGWSESETGDWLASVKIHSDNGCCKANFNDYVYSAFVGATEDGRTFQQIIIDPTDLPVTFYLEFSFNLGACRVIRKYTEPYKKTDCNDTTIKLEGLYNKGQTDCSNYYYGDVNYYYGDTPFIYRNLIRIPARIEQTGMEVTKEEVSNRNFKKTIRTNLKETYNLRSEPLAPYVIKKLKTIFMSKKVLWGTTELTIDGALNKNNDNGSMWLLDTTLTISNDNSCFQQDFTCNIK